MIPISRQESFPIDVSEAQEKLNLLKLSKAQEKLNLLEKVGRIGEFVQLLAKANDDEFWF